MTSREKDIDRRLENLSSIPMGPRGAVWPFEALIKRLKNRPDQERIAADYLSLPESTSSDQVGLKVLQVLESLRAPEVSRQLLRTAPIGPLKRPVWKPSETPINHRVLSPVHGPTNREAVRDFRSGPIPDRPLIQGKVPVFEQDIVHGEVEGTAVLPLDRALALHLGFVGNDLVIALDGNLGRFVYGNKFKETGKVHSSAFRDYGYNHAVLEPGDLIFGPVLRVGVRREILQLTEDLHNYVERVRGCPSPNVFRKMMRRLEALLAYNKISKAIRHWIGLRDWSLDEVCLVIAPDEALYLLPLGFLGMGRGDPLILQFGGISYALSLMALKWSIKDYHWTVLPNLGTEARCSFFGAGGLEPAQRLDIGAEAEALNRNFGTGNIRLPNGMSSVTSFRKRYSMGDICWFSGHGLWDGRRAIVVEGESIPFPRSGPVFADGVLTNLDLVTTSDWNFKGLWLTVMNSCLLGRSLLVGPNPLGFLSALHSVGSISSIAALWPVLDRVAIRFAEELSRQIVANYHRTDFPRARCLSNAIREMSRKDIDMLCYLAPYGLWGVP